MCTFREMKVTVAHKKEEPWLALDAHTATLGNRFMYLSGYIDDDEREIKGNTRAG